MNKNKGKADELQVTTQTTEQSATKFYTVEDMDTIHVTDHNL